MLASIQKTAGVRATQTAFGIKLIHRILADENTHRLVGSKTDSDQIVKTRDAQLDTLCQSDSFAHQVFAVGFLASHLRTTPAYQACGE